MALLPALLPDWRTALSALLVVLAFTPWDFTPLIWVALVPWLLALRRTPTLRAAFLEGVWFSLLMSLLGFYWVAHVLKEFGEVPWAAAIAGLLGYSLVGQPQFLAFSPLRRWILERQGSLSPSPWGAAALSVSGALLYTGIDWTIPKLFVDTLGHSFYASRNLRQAADLGGAPLLTFLAFLVNDAIAETYFRVRHRGEPSLRPSLRASAPQVAVALGVAASLWTYGWIRNQQIQELLVRPHPSLQLGVIQANIGDFDKVAAERGIRGAAETILERFFSLSDRALAMTPKPDALVWPETAFPSTFRTPRTTDELARDRAVERYVREREIPLLFGGYGRHEGKTYNSLFFLSPRPDPGLGGEGDLQIYRKNVLLIFGEYLPFAQTFPWLGQLFPQVANFGRGPGPEVLKVPILDPKSPAAQVEGGSVLAGPIICYEALFPNYVLEEARKGSHFFLNVTNDSWFGPYAEPYLHLSLTVFRSIEARRPQLRSTNTGISALIMPDGEIARRTRLGEPEVMNVSVPLLPPIPTLMLAWGDWFGPFALGAGALSLLAWVGIRFRYLRILPTE